MAVSTHSVFYYGYEITDSNKYFNFDEGAGELSAVLEIGAFTLTELLVILKTALDAVGSDTYSVSVDRTTRVITISSDGTFSILLSTGTQVGTSVFGLLGFTDSSDTATLASHVGSVASGFEYIPQFWLQDFISDDDFQEKIDSKVNESASGALEVFNFGIRKFTEMSFKFITDIAQDGHIIRNNPSGVSDMRLFLQDITKKNPIEFMIDFDSRNSFKKLVLESTPTSKEGTAYKLVELVKNNLPDYYEFNGIKFRAF